jgi:threonine dehydratase
MNIKTKIQAIDVKKEALKAKKRISKYIRETPVEYSPYLSQSGRCHVYLKLENFQLTGSFKLRGAMNKLLSLNKKEKEKGVVSASSGNHGVAFAHGLKALGFKGIIYLPENASRAKIKALRNYDIDMKFYGYDCVKAESFAREIAEKHNQIFISPYNDPKIIGGQATVGIELAIQLKKIDAILVPVGGGGLISGIAGYPKTIDKNIEIIGCQPENSPVMYGSIRAGKIIEMESKSTLSEGSAGGIEPGAVTFDICKDFVDDFILVKEDEIKEAIKLILDKHYMLVEGAATLSVASFLKTKERFENKNVVLILSGSKMSLDKLKEILCKKN